MHSAYLVRHGNAEYVEDGLTKLGAAQVRALYRALDARLPDDTTCSLVISDSGRTAETKDILLPLLEKKSVRKVPVCTEPLLSQTRSMGSEDTIISNGRENNALIGKYSDSGDHVFYVGHEMLLVSSANAIAVEELIELPPCLRLIEYSETQVRLVMDELGVGREEAIAKVKEWSLGPPKKIPPMAEGSALCFDFENRLSEYIKPMNVEL